MDHHIKSFYGKLSHLHICQFLFPQGGFATINKSHIFVSVAKLRTLQMNLYQCYQLFVSLQFDDFKSTSFNDQYLFNYFQNGQNCSFRGAHF